MFDSLIANVNHVNPSLSGQFKQKKTFFYSL